MEKYKVEYRIFTREPLLSSSVDYVFNAIEFTDNPMEFCAKIAEFDPQKCEDLVDDFVSRDVRREGKTYWVQQNCYRFEKYPHQSYRRIFFAAFRVDHFPAE